MTDEVYVVLLDFKTTISREMVTVNEDGSYTIFINSRLSNDAQHKAYEHALSHIKNGDFDKNDVQQIEAAAHELPKEDAQKHFSSFDYEEWLKRNKKKRARIKKQLKEYEEKIDFLMEHDPDGPEGFKKKLFNKAEDHYLYGDDL